MLCHTYTIEHYNLIVRPPHSMQPNDRANCRALNGDVLLHAISLAYRHVRHFPSILRRRILITRFSASDHFNLLFDTGLYIDGQYMRHQAANERYMLNIGLLTYEPTRLRRPADGINMDNVTDDIRSFHSSHIRMTSIHLYISRL